MNILTVEGLTKSYGFKPLLESVSFSVEDNEKIGLIGANGSGKTTLLRIIAGAENADAGTIRVPDGLRVAYLPQNPEFGEGLSVLDAVFDQGDPELRLLHDFEEASRKLAVGGDSDEKLLDRVSMLSHKLDVTGGWDREARAHAILDRLGITDPDEKVDTLSGGQRKRVALARTLLLEPDLLLLDEPTNHLDTDTIVWLETNLARYSGALVLVTHDRYFLDRVTNRMLEVSTRGVTKYVGNYSRYLELKEKQEQIDEATERTRRNLARRELAWLRRGAKARTSKAKYRIERALELQESNYVAPDGGMELSAAFTRLGNKVIEIDNISKSYGDQRLVENFSRILTKTDRIGIIGPNGSGKTTFLELISGNLAPDNGKIEIGETVVVGYFDQEGRPLDDSLRVIDTVTRVAEYVRTEDGRLISASQMLERFLFPPAVQYAPVETISGGERRRLHLLLVLMEAPNVLLLDEPTNDLDIPTLSALEDYLDTFPGVLVVVSHDRWFLDRTVDSILSFDGEGTIRSYPGDYSAYLEIRAGEAMTAEKKRTSTPSAKAPKSAKSAPDQSKRLSYNEKRELAETEKLIEQAEERKIEIEQLLLENSTDYEKVTVLSNELRELTNKLDRFVERWAELAERE